MFQDPAGQWKQSHFVGRDHILEEHDIRFSRLICSAATIKRCGEIIYLRVYTYNINAIYLILRKAGFKMYEPMAG